MNIEMAYLLGMICGNGEIRRGVHETGISIEIPHKKLATENSNDVRIYVRASITDIRAKIEPLVGTGLSFMQQDNYSIISFVKPNDDYLIREIARLVGRATSHESIRIENEVFFFSYEQKISFLQGFADTTGYIRRSNNYFKSYMHRVYLEIPRNWFMVADICNLLMSVDIPVQTIDWAHPNMRDGNMSKYNDGKPDFWRKEHQIKIWANEFLPVGFAVIHKREALEQFAEELQRGIIAEGKNARDYTHRYYWNTVKKTRVKPIHPCENDPSIPDIIRGKHYNSWKEIAFDLGYGDHSNERV